MSKTVMVIDDSASFRTVVGLALKKAGYGVVEAGDGKDALGKLGAVAKVNLIVCDVNMPNMDGLTFLKTLRTQAAHKFTPVIMLTTESGDDMKKRGQAAGARAWITKPFRAEVLLGAVQKLVQP